MKKVLIVLFLACSVMPIMSKSYVVDRQKMDVYRSLPDERITAAIKAITRDADKKLAEPVPTVMDKSRTAPSGDKHDYFSMAKYWWPNPNSENGLPYVRHDGKINPETEGLDRDALDEFKKWLDIYTFAYYYTGNEAYAQKGWELLRAWFVNKKTRMNPSMRYSQVRMGHANNEGSNSGVLDSYSFLMVPDAIDILSASKSTKAKDIATIKTWFSDYLDWMLTSSQGIKENHAENNHGTAYHIQVAVYALFVGNDSVAQLYLNDFVDRRVVPQVEKDGRQPKELARTRAYGYSCYNLKHYLDMMDICRLQGIDMLSNPAMEQRIEKAIDYLTPYLGKPVSAWPYQQIAAWEKEQQTMCWILYRADAYFHNKNYRQLFDTYNTSKSSRYFLIY